MTGKLTETIHDLGFTWGKLQTSLTRAVSMNKTCMNKEIGIEGWIYKDENM